MDVELKKQIEKKYIEIAFNPLPDGFAVDVYDGIIGNHVRHVADLTDKAIQQGLESLGWMHWLPMTPDAVFEDGARYTAKDADGRYLSGEWDEGNNCLVCGIYEMDRETITDYARITEPK